MGDSRLVYTHEMAWVLLHMYGPAHIGRLAGLIVHVRLTRGEIGEWDVRDGTLPRALEGLIRRGLVAWSKETGYRAAVAPANGSRLRKLTRMAAPAADGLHEHETYIASLMARRDGVPRG